MQKVTSPNGDVTRAVCCRSVPRVVPKRAVLCPSIYTDNVAMLLDLSTAKEVQVPDAVADVEAARSPLGVLGERIQRWNSLTKVQFPSHFGGGGATLHRRIGPFGCGT